LGVKTQTFNAVLEKGERALGWTIARVPFAPADVWPKRIRLRVKGAVNGFAFQTSLFPLAGSEGFYLLVNEAMQRGASVSWGRRRSSSWSPISKSGRRSFRRSLPSCWTTSRDCAAGMTP
jgi:hypothetical protein